MDNGLRETLRMRTETANLTDRQYNLALGLSLTYGFVMSAILAVTTKEMMIGVNPFIFCLLYLVLGFVGQIIASTSCNPFVTFFAYNLVVLPTGCLLSTFVDYYSTSDITYALISVAVIIGIMTCLATIFPQFFAGLGRMLFVSLLVSIVVELIMLFLGYGGSTVLDWVVVLIFTLYTGYDWVVAQSYAKTATNAIASSIALYLDAINLFVRILSILGKKNK